MNIEFVINDYLMAWYLLFKPSFCEEVQRLKEKLWTNYQQEYIKMQKENLEILKYTKDFIPDDDTVYNLVFETDIFKKIKKNAEKYKQNLLQVWDKNKKEIRKNLNEILRLKNELSYTILVVSPEIDVIEFIKSNPKKNIAWGKKEETNNYLKVLIQIIYTSLKYEMSSIQKENSEITTAIMDLAINNELYTRISGQSKYNEGYKKIRLLKKQLYPYFLMYLGCDREELVTYMMRDQMPFDIDKYTIEKGLRKIDLYGFIEFCCRNQRYIIRLNELNM